MKRLECLMTDRAPIRAAIRKMIMKTGIGSYGFRYRIGAVRRPNYAYLVNEAARLSQRLGEARVSILEFGVAGGDGLLALEHHAAEVEKLYGVNVEIYGFDTGAGLPPPTDYRDLPYHFKNGFYKMDRSRLETKLSRARLVIGDVSETVQTFICRYNPAPIGAVAHDLDFYSSTASALKLFDADVSRLLPRIACYFDDTIGGAIEMYNDFTGERLAIHEFNATHVTRKISPLYHLVSSHRLPVAWHYQMWSFHVFDHPKYTTFVSTENQQLPIC
jgi:hypothetical protein